MGKIEEQLATAGVAQVIVVLDDQSAGLAAEHDGFLAIEKHFTDTDKDQHSAIVDDGFVAAVGPSRLAADVAPPAASPAAWSADKVRFFENLGVAYGVVDPDGLAALEAENSVSSVSGAPQLSLVRPVKSVPIEQLPDTVSWGIGALDVPELWADGLTGEGVTIAHLDTGVDGSHPAFADDAIMAFAEVDRLGGITSGSPAAFDSGTHGTHTAGTLIGRPSVDGHAIGLAPKAKVATAIVIEGGDSVARILSGLNWAVGQGAQILSMSLGIRGVVADFVPLVDILRRRGMLPVVAVGNEGPATSRSPGNYVAALSVGWANRDQRVDPESSSQSFQEPRRFVPNLVAPGGDIPSARPGGGYQLKSGTSMATPHIAGLCALLWEAKPGATMDEITNAVMASCRLLPNVAAQRQGAGMPNAVKALEVL